MLPDRTLLNAHSMQKEPTTAVPMLSKRAEQAYSEPVTVGTYESIQATWVENYQKAHVVLPYGELDTYQRMADGLRDCQTIEDWGGGLGKLRTYLTHHQQYLLVDGCPSDFVDVVQSLEERHSQVDGVALRHVLEHNHNWETIFRNALASARMIVSLCVFTPFTRKATVNLAFQYGTAAPELALPLPTLLTLAETQKARLASLQVYAAGGLRPYPETVLTFRKI